LPIVQSGSAGRDDRVRSGVFTRKAVGAHGGILLERDDSVVVPNQMFAALQKESDRGKGELRSKPMPDG
jgi:hypothetical protein